MTSPINPKSMCVCIWPTELSEEDMEKLGDQAPSDRTFLTATVQSAKDSQEFARELVAKGLEARVFRLGPEVKLVQDAGQNPHTEGEAPSGTSSSPRMPPKPEVDKPTTAPEKEAVSDG